jgi:E3 SUMO-protein ligase PIAS1
VTIEPNGRWSAKSNEDESRHGYSNGSASHANYDEDDDDLEISEVSVVGGRRMETPKMAVQGLQTPASATSVASTGATRGLGSTSNKRPAPTVIDLTISSDEDDDEPIQRPAKRQNTFANGYSGANSLPFFRDVPF